MSLFSKLLVSGGSSSAIRVSGLLFLAAGLADGMLMPFFALWAVRDAGVPVAGVGLLLGCYAAGELAATPVVGGVSDWAGRRPVLIVSTLGVGCGFLLLFLAHGMLQAAAALLLIGSFESVLHPTAMAIVADVVPATELRRHFGWNRMAGSVGDVLGPLLGSLLVVRSLGDVFLAASITLLAAAVAVTVWLPETRTSCEPEEDDEVAAFGAVFRDRRLAAILVPLAVIEIASSWIEAVLPLAATHGGALTPSGVGLLFGYVGLLGVIFQMPVLHVCREMPGSRMVIIAAAVLALGFGTLVVMPGVAGFIVAATGFGFAGILLRPMVQAVVIEVAPAKARARYTAALSVVSDLRDAAGPALATPLFALAAGLPWLVGLILTVLAASGLVAVLRRQEAVG